MRGIPETFETHFSIHWGNKKFRPFLRHVSTQLQKEPEDNKRLSAGVFMAVMEGDVGKYFSTQAREEWRSVVLHNNGRNLKAKECRTFQLQFEIAAERVKDKGEREEYEM